jgi:hypothetical protein
MKPTGAEKIDNTKVKKKGAKEGQYRNKQKKGGRQ